MSAPLSSLAFAGAALVGIAAIGVGAAATFTASSSTTSTITAGTLSVLSSAPGTECAHKDSSGNCDELTLASVSPAFVGSTFETDPIVVTLHNAGTLAAAYDAIEISATPGEGEASEALLSQINVCIQGTATGPLGRSSSWTEDNGPLSTAIGFVPPVANPFTLAVGGADASFSISFYAGQSSTRCVDRYSWGTDTRMAWITANHGIYAAPPSLTEDAMGGSVTPTVKFSFAETATP